MATTTRSKPRRRVAEPKLLPDYQWPAVGTPTITEAERDSLYRLFHLESGKPAKPGDFIQGRQVQDYLSCANQSACISGRQTAAVKLESIKGFCLVLFKDGVEYKTLDADDPMTLKDAKARAAKWNRINEHGNTRAEIAPAEILVVPTRFVVKGGAA